MSGLFISFEGIDGVGKSTQIDLLTKHLDELGRKYVQTLEPGGTELGVEIRHLLLHRKGEVAPRAEMIDVLAPRTAVIVFLTFALAYFLSALLRAVTATLAPSFGECEVATRLAGARPPHPCQDATHTC